MSCWGSYLSGLEENIHERQMNIQDMQPYTINVQITLNPMEIRLVSTIVYLEYAPIHNESNRAYV